jgi:hypothetical protein
MEKDEQDPGTPPVDGPGQGSEGTNGSDPGLGDTSQDEPGGS